MFTTVAYEQTVSNAALTAITPVPDPTVAVISNDIRIPVALPNLLGVAAMINSALGTPRVQLVTPSLRAIFPLDVDPIVNALVWGGVFQLVQYQFAPIPLVGLEPMDAFVQNGAAVVNRALVWLGDGPIKTTTGKIYSIRATASATLVTATWVNSALVFANTLPTGHYQVVGARVVSTNGVGARIFFVGYQWRPGVMVSTSDSSSDLPFFRYGNYGVWGEFDNTVPPTIDVLGVTDTAQIVFLDLIKTA